MGKKCTLVIFVSYLAFVHVIQSQLLPPHYSYKAASKAGHSWNRYKKSHSIGSELHFPKRDDSNKFSIKNQPLINNGGLHCSDKESFKYVVQNITFTFNPNGDISCVYFACSKFESSLYDCTDIHSERGCRCGDETKHVGCEEGEGFAVGLVISYNGIYVNHADIVCFFKHEMLVKTLLDPGEDKTTDNRVCPAGHFMCGLDQSNADLIGIKDLKPVCCQIDQNDNILNCTFREDVVKAKGEGVVCNVCKPQITSKIMIRQTTWYSHLHVWIQEWMDWCVDQYFKEINLPSASWGVEDRVAAKIRNVFPNLYRTKPGLRKTLNESEVIDLPFGGGCFDFIYQEVVTCGVHLKYLTEVGEVCNADTIKGCA